MRVLNQITFEAKDDAEALRIATERLGRDAVIISSYTNRVGGFMGLFQHSVRMFTAGVLDDDEPKAKSRDVDDQTRRENLVAFQKLIEFKDRQASVSPPSPAPVGGEGYRHDATLGSPSQALPSNTVSVAPANAVNPASISAGAVRDNLHISPEGVRNAYAATALQQTITTGVQNPANVASAALVATAKRPMQSVPLSIPTVSFSPEMAPEAARPPVVPQAPDALSQGEAQALRHEISELTQRVDSLVTALTAQVQAQAQVQSQNQVQPSPQNPPAQPVPAKQPSVRVLSPISPASAPASISTSTSTGIVAPNTDDPAAFEAEITRSLQTTEVDDKYIRKLLADYNIALADTPETEPSVQDFRDWLATRIPCSSDGDSTAALGGHKILFLGPTGVGKTTTIAKLAAIQALWEHKNVLLLTSDTYRIAAVDQLRTYARILGVPIEVVFDATAIPELLESHPNMDLALLDTAGRSQRDRRSVSVFEALYNSMQPDAVHLVLAANMKYRDMLDVVEHIPNIPVTHLIFTKLDETTSYGAIFNIQQVMGCPISFLTGGQDVPKDIEVATGERIVKYLLPLPDEQERALLDNHS